MIVDNSHDIPHIFKQIQSNAYLKNRWIQTIIIFFTFEYLSSEYQQG